MAAWPSCRGPRQPAANELGGGPVRHVRLTELDRLAGPSAPRYDTPHLGADITPRISQRAEKCWFVRYLAAPPSPEAGGSAFPITTGSEFPIGIRCKQNR